MAELSNELTKVRDSADSGKQTQLHQSRFMKACRREPVDVTPVWLMRQAGRFMPEFREIRSRMSFLELCKDSEMACQVTVMAVDMLKVDAAIIFADILLPMEPLGVGLEYVKGEGPNILRPVRTKADVDALKDVDATSDLGYVMQAIRLTRRALPGDIPLLGFAGAPFTMASYMIEGGASKNFEKTKTLMYREPEVWHQLMSKLATMTGAYLNAQIEAGVQAVQLFDSWVGCLSPTDYDRFVAPYSKQAIDAVSGVPVIHFGTGTATLLPAITRAGGDVIGLDWRVNLADGWKIVGHDKSVQGNLDPTVLFGTKEEIARQADRVLAEAGGRPGHIFNLGHGVLPPTDPANVQFLVEHVHNRGTARA